MAVISSSEQLWARLWQGDLSAKQDLTLSYLPLVKRVVGRVSINLPAFIDRSDLEGAAVFGLIEAINGFRPDRGVKFETYAVARIRGAALDSLRSLDFVPRSVRQKARQVQEVLQTLISGLGRQPDQSEIAQALGISESELSNWWQELQSITMLSLDAPLDGDADAVPGLDILPDPDSPEPLAELLEAEGVSELAVAIAQLSSREQQLLSLYYDQGLTLRELGQVLGVSESRACQIHTAAIIKLRAKLLGEGGKKDGSRNTGADRKRQRLSTEG